MALREWSPLRIVSLWVAWPIVFAVLAILVGSPIFERVVGAGWWSPGSGDHVTVTASSTGLFAMLFGPPALVSLAWIALRRSGRAS